MIFLGLGIEGERYLAPYYWQLPSIACLDYDHEQQLFLKNLKYETRDLTFWKENGKILRLATINHLQDLKVPLPQFRTGLWFQCYRSPTRFFLRLEI